MRSNRAIILTVPDLERLRRFALAIGLVTLTYGVAGISLTAGATVSPFGIPFTISRPDFLPVGLAIASLYAAAPDLNMNDIDVTTGATQANWDKIFKQDGDTILGCYHNTRSLWNIAFHPGKNALYVPFHDQCLSMTANLASPSGYGPRFGVMRPGIDPDTYMGLAKIDVATGEMQVIYSQAQPTTAGRMCATHASSGRLNHGNGTGDPRLPGYHSPGFSPGPTSCRSPAFPVKYWCGRGDLHAPVRCH